MNHAQRTAVATFFYGMAFAVFFLDILGLTTRPLTFVGWGLYLMGLGIYLSGKDK